MPGQNLTPQCPCEQQERQREGHPHGPKPDTDERPGPVPVVPPPRRPRWEYAVRMCPREDMAIQVRVWFRERRGVDSHAVYEHTPVPKHIVGLVAFLPPPRPRRQGRGKRVALQAQADRACDDATPLDHVQQAAEQPRGDGEHERPSREAAQHTRPARVPPSLIGRLMRDRAHGVGTRYNQE